MLALALFVGGYLIQFLGHACDRTVPGELVALRRYLGRPRGGGAPVSQP